MGKRKNNNVIPMRPKDPNAKDPTAAARAARYRARKAKNKKKPPKKSGRKPVTPTETTDAKYATRKRGRRPKRDADRDALPKKSFGRISNVANHIVTVAGVTPPVTPDASNVTPTVTVFPDPTVTETAPPEIKKPSADTARENFIMGLFSSRKRTSEPPPEAPDEADHGGADDGHHDQPPAAQYGGYGYPVSYGMAGAPAAYVEHPNWAYRDHQEGQGEAVAALPPPDQPAQADTVEWMARAVALGMAGVTGYFSVRGLLTLFPGDTAAVIVFGAGVEFLKITGVMFLAKHFRTVVKPWLIAAGVTVLIAAGLNCASVYAKFASLHASSPASAAATREASAAELDAQIEAAQGRVNDLTRRAGVLDDTVDAVGKRSNSRNARRTINDTRQDRVGLSNDRQTAANDLARLRADRGRVTAAGHQASAEELPVTLMASFFGTDAATVLKWLIFAVVMVGDPAALVLLIAVGSRRKRRGF